MSSERGQESPESHLGSRTRLSTALHQSYESPTVQTFVRRLTGLHFVNTIMLFAASFLFSTLPLLVILDSLAGRRIDTDLTHHLGLDAPAAHVVDDLFVDTPSHSASAIVLALVLSLAGTLSLAGAVQSIYEQIFQRHHQGRTNIIRLLLWLPGLLLWLLFNAVISQATTGISGGLILKGCVALAGTTAFFWWSMHLMLGGLHKWRPLLLPAAVTGLLWIGLQAFAALYFSSTIISDSKLYGSVGVVFSLLLWFMGIGAVITLGALAGAVIQAWYLQHRVQQPGHSIGNDMRA
jgi:membrane protein